MDGIVTSDLIRGHIDTIILRLLLIRNMYGYEITKEITQRSNHLYELKEATLYSSMKRLEKEGYINSYWGDETQGGRRKYYAITKIGEALFETNKKNWSLTQQVVNKLLE